MLAPVCGGSMRTELDKFRNFVKMCPGKLDKPGLESRVDSPNRGSVRGRMGRENALPGAGSGRVRGFERLQKCMFRKPFKYK